MITDERRAFKRVNCKFNVKYKLQSGKDNVAGSFVTENISLGGVYFVGLEKFDIGQLLDCSIQIPGDNSEGKWTARVVRCDVLEGGVVNTFGIATEFVESIGDSQKKLKNILERVL